MPYFVTPVRPVSHERKENEVVNEPMLALPVSMESQVEVAAIGVSIKLPNFFGDYPLDFLPPAIDKPSFSEE